MKRSVKIVAAIVAASAVIAFVIYWNKPEVVFRREIDTLHNSVVNNNKTRTSQLLRRTASSGDWGKLEGAIKEYISDRFSSIEVLTTLQKSEAVSGALDVKNLREDGKEFKTSLPFLAEAKEQVEAARQKYARIATIDDALSFLDDSLDDSFREEFKKYIAGDFADSDTNQYVDNNFQLLLSTITVYIKELELLKKYPDSWDASGDTIKFSDKKVEDEYRKTLESVSEVK